MRISEIKKCFDDHKSVSCVKALWEEDLFRNALSKEKDVPDPEKVYTIIRDVVLQLLRYPLSNEKKGKRRYLKELKTLSKHIYGDADHWVIGTEWEKMYIERKRRCQRRIEINDRIDALSFLYEKLHLSRLGNSKDIVFQIARNERLSQFVITQESSDLPILKMDDLYSCLEKVILEALHHEEWENSFWYIMNCVSYLTYNDRNYWLIKNELKIEDIPTNRPLNM